MGKVLKKIAPIALSLAAPYAAPALGITSTLGTTALGAGLGAAGGALGGGGLKGALLGAATGGIGANLGSTSGAGGLFGSSGIGGGLTTSKAAADSIFNNALAGTAGKVGGGLSSLTSGSGGLSNLSSLARIGGSIYGGVQEDDAAEKARKAMLGSIKPYNEMGLKAQQQLSDNLSAGFNPGDLSQDPGYQFRLGQGQNALNSTLAAQGMGQSGAALKAAQEYGQGFAQNEYSNAYDRWAQQNSQLSGLGAQGLQTAGDVGNVQGNYYQQQAERKNKRISEILAGLGYA